VATMRLLIRNASAFAVYSRALIAMRQPLQERCENDGALLDVRVGFARSRAANDSVQCELDDRVSRVRILRDVYQNESDMPWSRKSFEVGSGPA
jgi:hypothetical protein